MAGFVESAAVFQQRCREIGMDGPMHTLLVAGGFSTMGRYAYGCGYVPGQSDDKPLIDMITVINGGTLPGPGPLALFRRLFFESFTLVQSELKQKLERTVEDAPPRKLAVPERASRFRAQQARLVGVSLRGELECADSLVDYCVAQFDENRVRYVTWDKCLSKAAELDGSKKDSTIGKNVSGLLKISEVDVLPEADLSTELLLKYALTRRGLAYDQASLITFSRHEEWVDRLFTIRLRAPLSGYSRVSLEQMERADREVWRRLAELTRDGIVPDGTGNRPLDIALLTAMREPEIAQLLSSMVAPSSSSSRRPPDSSARIQDDVARPSKKARKAAAKAAGASRPSEKGKGGKSGGKGGKAPGKGGLPAGLQGTSKTPDGANICYGFQFGTCTGPSSGCPKGKHVCTKCYGPHPFQDGGH